MLVVVALALGLGGCGDDDSGGNTNNNNQPGVCGDGTMDSGEACDDGTANSDTIANACRTDCREAWCGDGVRDTGEACDDGNGDNTDDCLTACTGTNDCCVANVCGDGHQNQLSVAGEMVEMCDDGNTVDDAECSGDCGQNMTLCGDGNLDQGEGCDDGGGNSDLVPNACRLDCHPASCGDGVRDAGESCDGSDFGADRCDTLGQGFDAGELLCTAGCALDTSLCTTCGDGVAEGDEVCDLMDFAGETCATQGSQFGYLQCSLTCDQIVVGSSCYEYAVTDISDPTVTANLNDVRGSGSDEFLVVGDGGLLRSFLSGTWTTNDLSGFTTENLYGVYQPSSAGFGFVGEAGTARAFALSVWVDLSSPLPNARFNAVFVAGIFDIFTVSSAGDVYYIDAQNPSPVDIGPSPTPPALHDLWAQGSSLLMVVGAGGTILEWDGAVWSPHSSGVTHTLYGIYHDGFGYVVVGGNGTDGVALYNDGTGWTSLNLPPGTPELRGVFGWDRDRYFAVGVGGTVLHYDGAWHTVPSGTTVDLHAIWGSSRHFYAVGDGGTVLHLEEQQ